MTFDRYALPVLTIIAAGALVSCTNAQGSALAKPTVDTLPSGIPRVVSPGPTAWVDTLGWRLVEEQRVQGGEGEDGELIDPQSLALDDAGRLYVADQKPLVIKVYDRNGRFVRAIGGEGAGPGEFRAAYIAVDRGRLVVHDPRLSRTSVFDTSGTFLTSWHSVCCYYSPIGIDGEGRIALPGVRQASGPSPGRMLVRYTLAGALVDTIYVPSHDDDGPSWTFRAGEGKTRVMMSTNIPFRPTMEWAYHPTAGVVYGWSGSYAVVLSPNGIDTSLVVGRAWEPSVIPAGLKQDTTEAIIRRLVAQTRMPEAVVRAEADPGDIPDTGPGFSDIQADQGGNLWIRIEPIAPAEPIRYDVFDSRGWYLGQVASPVKHLPWAAQVWGRNEMAVGLENENGTPVVARFRIERGGIDPRPEP